MSKVSVYPGQSGLTLNALLVRASDNGYVWTGAAFEALSTLTDAEIADALIALTEITSADSTHVGYELEVPSAISEKIVVQIFAGAYSVGMAAYATGEYDPASPTTITVDTLDASITTIMVEVADFLSWGRNTEGAGTDWDTETQARLNSIVKSGMRKVYYPAEVGEPGVVHEWSFLFPDYTLTTSAPYKTGTVEIVDGVVTLTGGVFPSWAASGELTVSSGTYVVSSRDSNTQLTLEDTTVDLDAGASYTLSRAIYDLPDDFDALHGEITYAAGQGYGYPPITIVSPQMVRVRRQDAIYTDRPVYAALQPKAFDTLVGQRWRIMFYPTPSQEFRLTVPYKVQLSLDPDANVYLPGGPQMAELVLESCLAIAEQRYREDGGREHSENFLRLLSAAVANDAQATAPDFLGYDGDREQTTVGNYRTLLPPMYNGQVYY